MNGARTLSHGIVGRGIRFILYTDFAPGRRILVWQRGDDSDPVIVVANFSDFQTENPLNPASEYFVPNWPHRQDFQWREVSQQRDVPAAFVGRESLLPWEAKVYSRR